jgi:hypothetical protein
MISPHYMRLGGSSASRVNQADALAQGKSSADNRKTSGFAYIDGDAIGVLPFGAFFPFDLEFHSRDYAAMGA